MASSYTVFIWMIYWKSYTSAIIPCIPANTCFAAGNNADDSRFDSSRKYRCDSSGTIHRDKYPGSLTCADGFKDDGASDILASGATLDDLPDLNQQGQSPGVYSTDFLMGNNCPSLSSASSACVDYFIVKHRGDNALTKPYSDMDDNCTNYLSDPSSFPEYDVIFMPFGCVSLSSGSRLYNCDADGWSFTAYPNAQDCTGDTASSVSDSFVVDKCGYKAELSRNDFGIQPAHWYWYDLLCCPNTTPCVAGGETDDPTSSPASGPVSSPVSTPEPASSPVSTPDPTTAQPVSSPASTPQPATVPSYTPQPAMQPATGSSPTTAAPTSPGTARPTSPTTAAPTDSSGASQPTSPTTAAPTSPGTAKPTAADQASTRLYAYEYVLCGLLLIYRLF